ncbi:hypothetical protein [Serinicoccus marinus]|uniref:hypothetical protein n=1 Tax=Serinicoccus marinus TaxID=247333 RepID=UPI00122E0F76|nr:hypothetical protein [Serinicoccus marinus]
MTTPQDRMRTFRMTSGVAVILAGFVSYYVSRQIDGGFWHGFFQGATLALMILGAFLVGSGRWPGRRRDGGEEQHWLPSRDGR